ncbi:tyrosine-type recombinase/integrase [Psychrobacillus psychrodurans]|uniref:tyrosine-type recombinase/integrase n=1 Tax=Psychrobacillus psychrodurans TaxID=126157 RepID=UPI001F4E6FD0|nr:tyrosine-type recombinase/integrase [Psychrobacillus psychrodurans]MCK1997035.1 tyrosine-type recombinase/integrase [Psychrobacillus psychrodurans]
MNLVDPIRDIEEIERMKKVLKSKNIRDYFLFVLGINSGLKLSDLLQLKFEDFFCDGIVSSSICIKNIDYNINTIVKECFLLYQESIAKTELDDTYIFRGRKGNNPIDRSHVYRILQNAALEAGLSCKIGTHTLRKTYGYQHYIKYQDIKYLQKLFKHNSIKQTFEYIGIVEFDRKKLEIYELNL